MNTSIRSVYIGGNTSVRSGERISTMTRISSGPGEPAVRNSKIKFFNWKQETLTESASGTDSIYNLLYTPSDSLDVMIFINGILQRQGIDYSVSERRITFVSNVTIGANVIASYNAAI